MMSFPEDYLNYFYDGNSRRYSNYNDIKKPESYYDNKCDIILKQVDALKEQIKNNQISSINAFRLLKTMKVELLSIKFSYSLSSSQFIENYAYKDDIDSSVSIFDQQDYILDFCDQTEEIIDNCRKELELTFGDLVYAIERVRSDLDAYGCQFISIILTEDTKIIVQNTNIGKTIIRDIETEGVTTEKLESIVRDLTLEVLE